MILQEREEMPLANDEFQQKINLLPTTLFSCEWCSLLGTTFVLHCAQAQVQRINGCALPEQIDFGKKKKRTMLHLIGQPNLSVHRMGCKEGD